MYFFSTKIDKQFVNKSTMATAEKKRSLTLRKEDAATLPAAKMKSMISMVAPGKPSEKNCGEQCLMIVLTISLKEKRQTTIY